ncbi:ribosomal protein S5 domain 2-type protein [Hyaloraphidium curvatum]|nr:ribosomal protein S5 domain 2-type protein [Hyaloraphidium curvatum]
MKVLASAPGKVILFGEHGVVYGKPAIAVSIDLRTYGLFESSESTTTPVVRLQLPDIGFDATWDTASLASAAPRSGETSSSDPQPVSDEMAAQLQALVPEPLRGANQLPAAVAFLYLYCSLSTHRDNTSVSVVVRSALPVGAGLGSSASYSVVISAGLLCLFGALGSAQGPDIAQPDPATINGWAFMAEKVIHGNPSGIDNTLCTYGGAKMFTRGKAQVDDVPGFEASTFLITNTNVPKNTMLQVANVRKRRDELPDLVDPIIEAIGAVSTTCKSLFVSGASREEIQGRLQLLVDMNHSLLSALGTSHPTLESVRSITARHGLASKLTGGGGGGCALTLVPDGTPQDLVDKVMAEIRAQGFGCFEVSVGGPGHSAAIVASNSPLEERAVLDLDIGALSAQG